MSENSYINTENLKEKTKLQAILHELHANAPFYIFLVVLAASCAALIVTILKEPVVALMPLGLFSFLGVFMLYDNAISRRADRRLVLFARDNVWNTRLLEIEKDLPPSIPFDTSFPVLGTVVDVKHNSLEYSVFKFGNELQYTEDGVLNISVAKLNVDKFLPPLFLNNKKGGHSFKKLPYISEIISLEGNFDQFFTLYSAPENRVETLTFITPDTMQTLLGLPYDVDIEFSGNTIFFIAAKDVFTPDLIEKFMTSIEHVMHEINHRLRSYTGSHKPAAIVSEPQAIEKTFRPQSGRSVGKVILALVIALVGTIIVSAIIIGVAIRRHETITDEILREYNTQP